MSTSSAGFPSAENKFSNKSSTPQTFLMTNSCMPEVSPGSSSASSGVSSSSDLQRPQQPSQPKIHEVQIRRIQTRPQPKRSSITGLPRMGISSSYPLQPASNLERIIRTHPIWYLPHLGRAAANHLLRPMPFGCFIVRASTRPSSMALSIKLPPSYGTDTDHYLLERHGPSTVKLEGSPHIFRSLPLLIEYYCQTADELQCKLTLPSAIQICSNSIDLQRIALMGQGMFEVKREGGILLKSALNV
uniref:SH2 domain-containing protein n=1 Tax=Panagrolaimus davidi TaxID=227884 RepID=A0A914P6F8_9BILA